MKKIEIQGHRGARGLAPENTIPAFKKAIDLGVHTLELDVVISADKQVVVSHEPQFNPAFSIDANNELVKSFDQYNMYKMSYTEIKRFDVGSRKNILFPEQKTEKTYKPLLKEVISYQKKYAPNSKIKYNIEIKSLSEEYNKTQPEPHEFIELVLKAIGRSLKPDQLCLQSFDKNILIRLNEINKPKKRFQISWLIEDKDDNEIDSNLELLGFKPDIWSPYYKTLTEDRIKKLHSKNIKVIPWTVNNKTDMENLATMGCDGLITDYPDRAKTIFKF